MKTYTDFSHLMQGAEHLRNRQRAEADTLSRQMTNSYHRAIGVSADESEREDTRDASPKAPKREQSEADKTVDEMRRAYNKGLGLPDDEIENRESDGKTHQDEV